MTPTSRTLKKLRSDGYHAYVVEKFNSFIKKRIDFAGCMDILAFSGSRNGVWGIQATSTGNISSRIKKSVQTQALRAWLLAGNRFSVWGWAKRGPSGQAKHWELKEVPITLDDLDEIPE